MPITMIGHSGPVENISTTQSSTTLSEPAGVQQGDLLIAWFSHRTTVGYAAPAGWTKLLDASAGNNSVTTSTSIASGELFYTFRGASAPTYVFSQEGAGGTGYISQGRVVAYRGVDQVTPFMSSVITTLAANATVVASGATLSGSVGDLAVLFIAGADNVTLASWQVNATTVLPLIEVADTGTNSGADTANAFASGQLAATISNVSAQATASLSARHVIAAVILNGTAASSTNTLTDDFSDNSRDTAKWDTGNPFNLAAGPAPVEANGRLEITPATNVVGYNGYMAVNEFNLIGSSVFAKLSQGTNNVVGVETSFGVTAGTNVYYELLLSGGQLHPGYATGGSSTTVGAAINYDAPTHTWFRIRESGGTIFWDTAPSTASDPPIEADWVNQRSVTIQFSPAAVRPYMMAGEYQAATGGGTAIFECFNTSTTAVSITGTLSASLTAPAMVASGSEIFSGSLSSATPNAALSMSGAEVFSGQLASVASGTVMAASGGELFSGVLSTLLAEPVLSMPMDQKMAGALSSSLGDPSMSMAGSQIFQGVLFSTSPDAAMSASGSQGVSGSLSSGIVSPAISASGIVANPVTGVLTAELFADIAMYGENSAAQSLGSLIEFSRKGRR